MLKHNITAASESLRAFLSTLLGQKAPLRAGTLQAIPAEELQKDGETLLGIVPENGNYAVMLDPGWLPLVAGLKLGVQTKVGDADYDAVAIELAERCHEAVAAYFGLLDVPLEPSTFTIKEPGQPVPATCFGEENGKIPFFMEWEGQLMDGFVIVALERITEFVDEAKLAAVPAVAAIPDAKDLPAPETESIQSLPDLEVPADAAGSMPMDSDETAPEMAGVSVGDLPDLEQAGEAIPSLSESSSESSDSATSADSTDSTDSTDSDDSSDSTKSSASTDSSASAESPAPTASSASSASTPTTPRTASAAPQHHDSMTPEHDSATPVRVQTASFPDLGSESIAPAASGDLGMLADVELDVTVELGRRRMPLSDILRLTSGSVVELEKLVGEPLQIFANNRLIAEGEAVVIDDQFGVRITSLASRMADKKFA